MLLVLEGVDPPELEVLPVPAELPDEELPDPLDAAEVVVEVFEVACVRSISAPFASTTPTKTVVVELVPKASKSETIMEQSGFTL